MGKKWFVPVRKGENKRIKMLTKALKKSHGRIFKTKDILSTNVRCGFINNRFYVLQIECQ